MADEARPWIRAIRSVVLRIPRGRVASYSDVAAAAGFPGYHRQVAQVLSRSGHGLPWHRVLGADGGIKTGLDHAFDQRTRLEMEGVRFRGRRVDMAACAFDFSLKASRRSLAKPGAVTR